MNLQFVREAHSHYLEVRPEQEFDPDAYESRMLLSGTCRRLLRCSLHHSDGSAVLRYDISSLKPLHIAFAGLRPDYPLLASVLGSLAKGLLELSECLLDPSRVLLSPGALFLDVRDHSLFFVYVPGEQEAFIPAFGKLLLSFFGQCDPDDQKAALLLFRLYRRCLEETVSPELILTVLAEETDYAAAAGMPESVRDTAADPEASPVSAAPQGSVYHSAAQGSVYHSAAQGSVYHSAAQGSSVLSAAGHSSPEGNTDRKQKRKGFFRRFLPGRRKEPGEYALPEEAGFFEEPDFRERDFNAPDFRDRDFNAPDFRDRDFNAPHFLRDPAPDAMNLPPDTDVPGNPPSDGCTTVLHERKAEGARLVPSDGNSFSEILLEKKGMTLGKQPGAADKVLPHPAVSRLHARITFKGGTYYIEDLCSKNGTCLNGVPLAANERHPLKNGDKLRLSALYYTVVLPDRTEHS